LLVPACGESTAPVYQDAGTGESDADTGEGDGDGDGDEPTSIPILGNGTHDIETLDVTIISSPADGLAFPTDLEFKPGIERELWVTNRSDFSIVVYQDAGRSGQVSMKFQGATDNGQH